MESQLQILDSGKDLKDTTSSMQVSSRSAVGAVEGDPWSSSGVPQCAPPQARSVAYDPDLGSSQPLHYAPSLMSARVPQVFSDYIKANASKDGMITHNPKWTPAKKKGGGCEVM